jgi:hypothetical protein
MMEIKEEGDKLDSEVSPSTCLPTRSKTYAPKNLLV